MIRALLTFAVLTASLFSQQRVYFQGLPTNFFYDSSVVSIQTGANGDIWMLCRESDMSSGIRWSSPYEYYTNTSRVQWSVSIGIKTYGYVGQTSAPCQLALRTEFANGPWQHELLEQHPTIPGFVGATENGWYGPQTFVTGLPNANVPALGDFGIRLGTTEWSGATYPNACVVPRGTFFALHGQVTITPVNRL